MTVSRIILTSFILAVMISPAFAQNNVGPLVLDPAFAQGGKAEVEFPGTSALASCFVAHKPLPGLQNQILIACAVQIPPDGFYLGIAEFDSNGIVMRNFGNNGISDNGWSNFDYPYAISLLSNGSILVSGCGGPSFYGQPAIYRLKSNGAPDSSFGTNGRVMASLEGGGFTTIDTLHIGTGAGPIRYLATCILPGFDNGPLPPGIFAMCIDAGGRPDSSFGTNGESFVSGPLIGGTGHLVPDGGILFDGITIKGTSFEIVFCKLGPNGIPDSTFGIGSILHTGILLYSGSSEVCVYDPDSTKLDPYRSLIFVGHVEDTPATIAFTVLKFKLDGTLDSNFGHNGYATAPIISNMTPQGLTISNDGSILVCGSLGNVSAATKFFLNGTLDTTFGVKGVALLDPDSGLRRNSLIGFLPASLPPPHPSGGGQRFLGIGTSVNASGNDEFLLARYMPASAGVREQETSTGNATVYPNPAHSFVYIESKSGPIQHITITDALGRIIEDFSKPSYAAESETYDLDVSGLTAGAYNCMVRTTDGVSNTRFTVLH